MNRRDFLRGAGAFIVGARLLAACGDDNKQEVKPDGSIRGVYGFPQGVASGDPKTTSVVLWTRAVKLDDLGATVSLKVQVATDDQFTTLVVDKAIEAGLSSDHTVRVMVTDLTANTTYYYRFVAGADEISGRTRTAPDASADVQVNVAWVSCQDYQAGHYGAYAQMVYDDQHRPEADQVHFVVHLGDVIYETINESSQKAIDANFNYVVLKNVDGSDRIPGPFPSGGGANKEGARFARTLDDYRHLYKTFMADPSFQAARARWPFIHTWDDHEFTNDSWQSMANYIDGGTLDEPSQSRKLAASRAWFEYVPALLTGATGPSGVTQDAKDFAAAAVSDARFTAPNDDNFVAEPNNAAAIGAMTIYRSIRWGKHVELVMTDERSYRSDHAIPEDMPPLVNAAAGQTVFFDPRNFLPIGLVGLFDQGKTANGGNPPATIAALGNLPNPRYTSPVGTMLGKAQKAWFKSTMQASDATWKLWGNEVPMMRVFVRGADRGLGFDRILDGDAWDGYPTERAELLSFLRAQNIKNVVVLSGDIHAHFAGVLMDNYDASSPNPVACELVAAGISSNSLFSFYESATRNVPAALRALVTVDATAGGGSNYTENLNLLVLRGTLPAGTYVGALGQGATDAQARGAALAATPEGNPHIRYVDTNAQGYGYVKITATQIEGSLITIKRPIGPASTNAAGILRTATFTIPKDDPASMSTAMMTGENPFPF